MAFAVILGAWLRDSDDDDVARPFLHWGTGQFMQLSDEGSLDILDLPVLRLAASAYFADIVYVLSPYPAPPLTCRFRQQRIAIFPWGSCSVRSFGSGAWTDSSFP
jgi:hypothetical protein